MVPGSRFRLLPSVLSLALLAAVACSQKKAEGPRYPTVTVERGSLALTAAADGVIEPIRKVEVKSKASGEVIAMHADTGDHVTQGQVLIQLLPRDAQNAYDQAIADLESATARLGNAQVRLGRSQKLHDQGLLASSDLEIDQLAVTTATSDVVRATKSRDNASERLSETTVRSPISGTVIAKTVEIGQVVSSAVSQVTGGTLLMTLADLSEVQIRSLVDEVDIGRVKAGMPVAIRVEAFPERSFKGEVLKIEPQAVVQQNVTMFPVLTRIDNREELLKPGMNAEIEVLIDRRENVLVVSNDALKAPEEARRLADMLGLGGALAGGPRDPQAREGRAEGARGEANGRVAFVAGADGSYQPVPVRVGLRNWEVTEVLDGLAEGARVVILPSAAQLRSSEEFRQRMERMRGIPGMSGGTGSGSGQRRGPG